MAIEIRVKQSDKSKHTTRYFSKKQETKVAETIGGVRTPNSGATMFAKGDLLTDGPDSWLLECKTCEKKKESFAIKEVWLKKNVEEALFMGKPNNALIFNFGPNEKNYVIIDEDTFKRLIEKK